MKEMLKQRKFILTGLIIIGLVAVSIYVLSKKQEKQEVIEIKYLDMNEKQQEELKTLTEATQLSDDETQMDNSILNINVKLNNELTFATLCNSPKILHDFADGVFEQDKVVILAYNTYASDEGLQQFYMISQKFDELDDYTAQIYAANLTTNIVKNLKADPSIEDVHVLHTDPEYSANGFDIFNFQVTYTLGTPENFLSVDAFRCGSRLVFLCYQSAKKPITYPFIIGKLKENSSVNQ